MTRKPSCVTDCWNSLQYMFHREKRHICRRPPEISNPMKFLHSRTHYLYFHRTSQSFQTFKVTTHFGTNMHEANLKFLCTYKSILPIPVAVRSKAPVCGRSPAEIVGSNTAGGMDVCLLWVLSVVRQRSLRRADHSSRVVLPTVMRRCVWSRNLDNEEALSHWGLLQQKENEKISEYCYYFTL